MPAQDLRTPATASKGKNKTSGRMNVLYRNTRGGTQTATVLAQGTSSGLKISVQHPTTTQILDNVPKMTARNQTGVYIAR